MLFISISLQLTSIYSVPSVPFVRCGGEKEAHLSRLKITNYLDCAHVCTMFRKAFEYFKHSSQGPPVESQAAFHQRHCGSISVKMELRWPTIADWWDRAVVPRSWAWPVLE